MRLLQRLWKRRQSWVKQADQLFVRSLHKQVRDAACQNIVPACNFIPMPLAADAAQIYDNRFKLLIRNHVDTQSSSPGLATQSHPLSCGRRNCFGFLQSRADLLVLSVQPSLPLGPALRHPAVCNQLRRRRQNAQ